MKLLTPSEKLLILESKCMPGTEAKRIADLLKNKFRFSINRPNGNLIETYLSKVVIGEDGEVDRGQEYVRRIAKILDNANTELVAKEIEKGLETTGVYEFKIPKNLMVKAKELAKAIVDNGFSYKEFADWLAGAKEYKTDADAIMSDAGIHSTHGLYTQLLGQANEAVYEGRMTIKRPYRRGGVELKPAVTVADEAVMRNKIVKFLGSQSMARASRTSINEFFNTLNEDIEVGRRPSASWLYRNTHLVKRIKIGRETFYKLTRAGLNLYNKISKQVNEASPSEQLDEHIERIIRAWNDAKEGGYEGNSAVEVVARDLGMPMEEVEAILKDNFINIEEAKGLKEKRVVTADDINFTGVPKEIEELIIYADKLEITDWEGGKGTLSGFINGKSFFGATVDSTGDQLKIEQITGKRAGNVYDWNGIDKVSITKINEAIHVDKPTKDQAIQFMALKKYLKTNYHVGEDFDFKPNGTISIHKSTIDGEQVKKSKQLSSLLKNLDVIDIKD